jgi:hypothetical protein
MAILKILAAAVVIMVIALAGLSIRLLFKKKGEFRGGSCSNITPELREKGISCGCGDEDACAPQQSYE